MKATKSNLGAARAQSRRIEMDRRLRGHCNASVGSQSVILDFGASLTKVMCAADSVPRLVVQTPPAVCAALTTGLAGREEAVAAFTHFVCHRGGVMGSTRAPVVLVNAVRDADVERLVVALVRSYSPTHRVRTLCAQVAALVAHGAHSGTVVDIGFRRTLCLPVLREVGCQFECVASVRGLRSVLHHVRRQLFESSTRLQQHLQSDALLPTEAIIDFIMQFGTVAPPVGDPQRDAVLEMRYPFSFKTFVLFAKPNLAVEELFAAAPSEVAEDAAASPDVGADRSIQSTVAAALLRCDALTVRPDAAACCVLTGGITQLRNFSTRFAHEVLRKLDANDALRPFAAECRMPPTPPGLTPVIAAVAGAAVIVSAK